MLKHPDNSELLSNFERLNVSPSVLETLLRLGDQSYEYTPEEKVGLDRITNLLETDKDLARFSKLVPKCITIVALRICKMDAELVFRTAKSFFTVCTTSHPDLVGGIDCQNFHKIADAQILDIVKSPNNSGPVVVLFRAKAWNPELISLEELVLYAVLLFVTVSKWSPQLQRSGFILIGDMEGFKLAHVRYMTSLRILSKMGAVLTKVPTKIVKGSIFINCYPAFTQAFKVVKWVLPKRIRKIVHLSKNNMITRLISRDELPVLLGGTLKDNEAFDGEVVKELFSDPDLVESISYIISEALIFTGYKERIERG